MLRLLKLDGVRFLDNRDMNFSRLEPLGARSQVIHAEGRWAPEGETDDDPEGRATVAVAFGPQYGPVTAKQVEEVIRAAIAPGLRRPRRRRVQLRRPGPGRHRGGEHPKLRIHMAHIRPDVNPGMKGLLKEQPAASCSPSSANPVRSLEPAAR